MFILENPYISTLLLKTLEKNQFEVLENSLVSEFKDKYNLNIINTTQAATFYKPEQDLKIYSNSEKSIECVLNN